MLGAERLPRSAGMSGPAWLSGPSMRTQAVEPACWAALLKGRKAVLAGDHLQVRGGGSSAVGVEPACEGRVGGWGRACRLGGGSAIGAGPAARGHHCIFLWLQAGEGDQPWGQ